MLKDEIWKEYQIHEDLNKKNILIEEYAYIIKIIASKMYNLYGGKVEFDDLLGYGSLGLIDAIDKFDITKGVKFETYAQHRIRGTIIDNLRKNDWVPRTLRTKAKLIKNTIMELENKTGKNVTYEDISIKLNIEINEVENIMKEINRFNINSLDEIISNSGIEPLDTKDDPQLIIEDKEFLHTLASYIDKLAKNEREVITLYYYEELNYKEIGSILKLSESRISQIHSKAIKKLKSKLINYEF